MACAGARFCQAIADAGGAAPFVRMCNAGFSDAIGAHATGIAASTLANMSKAPGATAAVVAAGAIPALVRVLDECNRGGDGGGGGDSAGITAKAAMAIGNLVDEGRVATAASRAGAPAALVQLLHSSRSTEAQAAAAGALSNLTADRDATVCQAIADADGIATLAARLCSSRDSKVVERACRALRHLACDSHERASAIAAATGCVPRLVRLLGSSGEASTQVDAGLLVLTIINSGAADVVVHAGAIPPLVKQLRSSQGSWPTALAASALCSLAHSNHSEAVLAAGAAPLLERLRQASPDEAVREAAAEALDALSSHAAAPSGSDPAAQPAGSRPRAPRVCARCGATGGKLRRCAGCLAVRYCSEACSVAGWRDHKARCKSVQAEREAAAAASTVAAAPAAAAARDAALFTRLPLFALLACGLAVLLMAWLQREAPSSG